MSVRAGGWRATVQLVANLRAVLLGTVVGLTAVAACGTRGGEPTAAPAAPAQPPAADRPPPGSAPTPVEARPAPTPAAGLARCYPYLRAADGSCPTSCATRDDCAGSRGPADLAEHGWPLDCINRACVPLSPAHVHGP